MQSPASGPDDAVSPTNTTATLPAEQTTPLARSTMQSSSLGLGAAALSGLDLVDGTASLDLASPTRPGPVRLFNLGPPSASASVPLRSPSYSNPIPLFPDSATSEKPFSYKTHFKRAYLTESAWLRGPGRLLSTQMSTDDGVVTSLGFDSEWIVVGMATSKVHVFEAETGGYVKTLEGHQLGVWSMTLVSSGGGPAGSEQSSAAGPSAAALARARAQASTGLGAAPGRTSSGERSFTIDSSAGRSNFFRNGRGDDHSSDRDRPTSPTRPRRRRSFHAFGASDDQRSTSPEGPRVGGMGLGAGGETGDSSQQAGVCGTARGWGQKGAVVVTGGCDRDVRVWDLVTG